MRNLSVYFFLLFTLLLPTSTWSAEPQSPEEAEQQIQKLKAELKSLNTWLEQTQSEKSNVEDQLEEKEKSINQLIKRIKELQESIKKSDKQIKDLAHQQRNLKLEMSQQNDQIAAQLRAVYRSGEQEGLKFLLDGRSPEETTRMIRYNRYVSQARQSLINGYSIQADELASIEKNIRTKRAQQAREEAQLAQEKSSLAKGQQEHKLILAKLNKDLKVGDSRVKSLQRDQKQLETLLEKLNAALLESPVFDENVAFSQLKGKLAKPLSKLTVEKRVNYGGGIVFAGKLGDSVKAIYNGRVIFADWLRGFGLVIILDHGQGYMSLYGYNQSLLKEVGEWVNANDTLATVGNSGGQSIPGLFFSIRHNGTPINPLDWVARG